MPEDEPVEAEEGSWCDTYALHFPEPVRKRTGFDRGVGAGGYDRGTGGDVPIRPRLKRAGEEEPAADPFGEGDPEGH